MGGGRGEMGTETSVPFFIILNDCRRKRANEMLMLS